MDRPDPDPYVSYTSHTSNKSDQKKPSKKRRKSQSSTAEATAPDAAATERSLEGSRPVRESSQGSAGQRDGGSSKRKRTRSSSSQRSVQPDEAKSTAVALGTAAQHGTDKPTDVPGTSSEEKDLHGDSKATATDAAAPERSLEGSRPAREPSQGTPGKRDGGSSKRKRKRSTPSQRSVPSVEAKSMAAVLGTAAQQGTDKPTDDPGSSTEKYVHGDSKRPVEAVAPTGIDHGAVPQPGMHVCTGAAATSTAVKDQHPEPMMVCILPDEGPRSGAAVSPDKTKKPDASVPNIDVNAVTKAPPSGPAAHESNADMG